MPETQDTLSKFRAHRAQQAAAASMATAQPTEEMVGPPAPAPAAPSLASRMASAGPGPSGDLRPETYAPMGRVSEEQAFVGMDPELSQVAQPVKAVTAFMLDNLPEVAAAASSVGAFAGTSAMGAPLAAFPAAVAAAGPGSVAGSKLKDKIMGKKTETGDVMLRAAGNMAGEMLGQGIFLGASGVKYLKNQAIPYYWQQLWKKAGGRPVREAAEVLRLARDIDTQMATKLIARGYTADQVDAARRTGATLSDLGEGKLIDWVENAARTSVFTKNELNELRSVHRDLIDIKVQNAVEAYGPKMHPDDIADILATRAGGVSGELSEPGAQAYDIVEQRLKASQRVVMEQDPMSGALGPKTKGFPRTPAKPAGQVGEIEKGATVQPDYRLGQGQELLVPENTVTESVVNATGTDAGLVNTLGLKGQLKDAKGVIPGHIARRIQELPDKAEFGQVRRLMSELKAHMRAAKESKEPLADTLKTVGGNMVAKGRQALLEAAQAADRAMAGDKAWEPLAPTLAHGELLYRDGKSLADDAVFRELLAYGTKRADAARTGRALLDRLMADGNDRAIHRSVRMLSRTEKGREAVQAWQRSVLEDAMHNARKNAGGTTDPAKFLEQLGSELTVRASVPGGSAPLIAKPELVALLGKGRTEHLVKQLRRMSILLRRNPVTSGGTVARVGDTGVVLGSAAVAGQALTGQAVSPGALAGFAGYILSIRGVSRLLMKPETTDLLFKALQKPAFTPRAQGRWGQNPAGAVLISKLLASVEPGEYQQVQ